MNIIKDLREILLFVSMFFSFLGVYLVGVNSIGEVFSKTENIYVIVTCVVYLIMSITMVVFDNSLRMIYRAFKEDYTYVLIGKDDVKIISCKAYLKYKDYYLIIENKVEKYISKGEVIRIEKMTENKKVKCYNY